MIRGRPKYTIQLRIKAFFAKVNKRGPICRSLGSRCWLWTGAILENGYGLFWDGKHNIRAHRFAYETFVEPIPDGLHVLHSCDVRCCVNPLHLFAGTEQDNKDDMVAKCRQARGELLPQTKLTVDSVCLIRKQYLQGVSVAELRRRNNLKSETSIYNILQGKNWKHAR